MIWDLIRHQEQILKFFLSHEYVDHLALMSWSGQAFTNVSCEHSKSLQGGPEGQLQPPL